MQVDEKKLKLIGKDTLFRNVMRKLTLNEVLSPEEKLQCLTYALIFLNAYAENKTLIKYADVAYYLILKYSMLHQDFTPLYDFSVNFGFYPIAQVLLQGSHLEKSITDHVVEISLNKYRSNKGYVETHDQFHVSQAFLEGVEKEKSYVAPTSFGKSSLIIDYIRTLPQGQRIAIIVPTKSLLMQVFRLVKGAQLDYKVILHDEMFHDDSSFIAVFTQERALRLMNKKGVCYDVLVIDEAHKILDANRGILISRLIEKNHNLKPDHKVIYLSPLVKNAENLRVTEQQEIVNYEVPFNLKEPELFELTEVQEIYKYNRFIDDYFRVGVARSKSDYIKSNAGKKNLIFVYTPSRIERTARGLSTHLEKIPTSEQVANLKKILAREVHPRYYVLDCLDYGVIYLHGKLPDLIKEYLEHKFKTLPEIKYLVANTVILEGINFPIDTLFINGARQLDGKSLTNLIGRVNRLDSIFTGSVEDLQRLLPRVHFLNLVGEVRNKTGHNSKFPYLRSRVFEDVIKNPTLISYDIEKVAPSNQEQRLKYEKKIEAIQSSEKLIYSLPQSPKESIKKYFIENNLHDYYRNFDATVEACMEMQQKVEGDQNWQEKPMMAKIASVFITDPNNVSEPEFKRLQHESTQKYYDNYYKLGVKQNLSQNVLSQIKYFKANLNTPIYVGTSYGDTAYSSEDYSGGRKVYANLVGKTEDQLVNLAIVKVKMEEDFAGFTLNKFIQALFDLGFVTQDDYNSYLYGTDDQRKIGLTQLGLNLSLISRLEEADQLKNLEVDKFNNLKANADFYEYLSEIDDFHRFEIERFLV